MHKRVLQPHDIRMTPLTPADASKPSVKVYPSTPRVRQFCNLDGDDFRHPIDQQTTSMLRSLPGLEMVARAVLGGPQVEEALYLENVGSALRVGPNQLSTLHNLTLEACDCLNMEAPALYVRQVCLIVDLRNTWWEADFRDRLLQSKLFQLCTACALIGEVVANVPVRGCASSIASGR